MPRQKLQSSKGNQGRDVLAASGCWEDDGGETLNINVFNLVQMWVQTLAWHLSNVSVKLYKS